MARAATAVYCSALHDLETSASTSIGRSSLPRWASDLDPDIAAQHVVTTLAGAHATKSTATLDMEEHRYTERTVDACLELARQYLD